MSQIEGYDPQTGEWNDSLLGEFLWSNVNVSEAVSGDRVRVDGSSGTVEILDHGNRKP